MLDDRRVDHALAFGDATEGVDEHRDIGDTFLEEVPAAFGLVLEQTQGVRGLDVVRQDEHSGLGMCGPDLASGDDAFVAVCGRQSYVHEHDVGSDACEAFEQPLGCLDRGDDVDSSVGEQPSDALAQKQLVLDDHDPHGISTSRTTSSASGLTADRAAGCPDAIGESREVAGRRVRCRR